MHAQAPSQARVIMDEMLKSMSRVITASARVTRLERIDGTMVSGEMKFKGQFSPHFKAYVYNILPDEGAEVLYSKGWNNDNAYVHPNKFPWVNVSLDPEGGTMTSGQHHTIMCLGFAYTESILRYNLAKYAKEFDEHVKYDGTKTWYGKTCHVLKITYNDYKFVNYTVLPGENLFDIDSKLKVPAAKIIEINPTVKSFDGVKAGQVIKVPSVYAKETIMLIDQANMLPVVQIVHDEKGLFEKYEYHDLKVNPRFSTSEFTTEFPDYGF